MSKRIKIYPLRFKDSKRIIKSNKDKEKNKTQEIEPEIKEVDPHDLNKL